MIAMHVSDYYFGMVSSHITHVFLACFSCYPDGVHSVSLLLLCCRQYGFGLVSFQFTEGIHATTSTLFIYLDSKLLFKPRRYSPSLQLDLLVSDD